jgi:dsRNA-specific ribonuclease
VKVYRISVTQKKKKLQQDVRRHYAKSSSAFAHAVFSHVAVAGIPHERIEFLGDAILQVLLAPKWALRNLIGILQEESYRNFTGI